MVDSPERIRRSSSASHTRRPSSRHHLWIWLQPTDLLMFPEWIKALEKYGFHELAAANAAALVNQMNDTFKDYAPHTIWECYNPNKAEPSTERGKRARPDFCGWSALGPISLFMENILGFHTVDAGRNEVQWRLSQPCRHGIEHLRFGKVDTDIIFDGKSSVSVKSNAPYKLIINGRAHQIPAGSSKVGNIQLGKAR